MNKITVFILLLSIMAKPLYVGVVYGNYFLDVDGFIEKYCVNKEEAELQCNGKCELSKQLNSSSQKSSTDSVIINIPESFVMVYSQFFKFDLPEAVYFRLENPKVLFYNQFISILHRFEIDYPPEL